MRQNDEIKPGLLPGINPVFPWEFWATRKLKKKNVNRSKHSMYNINDLMNLKGFENTYIFYRPIWVWIKTNITCKRLTLSYFENSSKVTKTRKDHHYRISIEDNTTIASKNRKFRAVFLNFDFSPPVHHHFHRQNKIHTCAHTHT